MSKSKADLQVIIEALEAKVLSLTYQLDESKIKLKLANSNLQTHMMKNISMRSEIKKLRDVPSFRAGAKVRRILRFFKEAFLSIYGACARFIQKCVENDPRSY